MKISRKRKDYTFMCHPSVLGSVTNTWREGGGRRDGGYTSHIEYIRHTIILFGLFKSGSILYPLLSLLLHLTSHIMHPNFEHAYRRRVLPRNTIRIQTTIFCTFYNLTTKTLFSIERDIMWFFRPVDINITF